MVKEHHQYCGSGSEASFRFFVEKPLYEIYLTRIKEQVDERRNTVGIHKNTDCLLKNSPQNIRNMLTLSIKNSEDVSVGSDFFLIYCFFLKKIIICHFLTKVHFVYISTFANDFQ